MKTLADLLHSGTESKQLSNESTKKSKPISAEMKNEKAKQLRYLIDQCDTNFRKYARQPEELEDIFNIFSYVLDNEDPKDVTEAFNQWLKTGKEFPIASDIFDICRGIRIDRSRTFSSSDTAPARPKPVLWSVPWAGLLWHQFTDDHRQQFVSHLASMELTRAVGYLKYCRDWIEMPMNVFHDFMNGYAPAEIEVD